MCEYPYQMNSGNENKYRTQQNFGGGLNNSVNEGVYPSQQSRGGGQSPDGGNNSTTFMDRAYPINPTHSSFTTSINASAQKNGGIGNNVNRSVILKQADALDENRIVLYKRGKQLGRGYYIVEISSNNTHLYIAAYDVESPESLLIELPERKASEILTEFKNDYE